MPRYCSGMGDLVDDAGARYELLAWRDRIQTAPTLPGSGEQWIKRLPLLLEVLAGATDADETINVPGFDEPLDIAEVVKKLGPSLVTRRNGRVVLTDGAKQWIQAADAQQLILHIHRHVRLVGELLALLSDGPRSHDELRLRANSRYGMNWTALDQLRRRTTWLRGSGHVELYDGKVHLTETGAALLDWIPLGDPETGELDTAVSVACAPPVIDRILEPLHAGNHEGRSEARSLYLPSPEGVGPTEVLKAAVRVAVPMAVEGDLDKLFQQYGLAEASARQARASLRLLGLIERAGLGRWSATGPAVAWLESNDDVDLIRIVHSCVWFVGEILYELQDGPADAATLAAQSTKYGRDALRVPGLRTRFILMRECGLVEKYDHQRYQLTPAGKAFLADLPNASRIESSSEPTKPTDEPIPTELTLDDASLVASELIDAMRDSRHPTRFERAIHDALSYLHLEVEHLSGPARTDLAATLLLPSAGVVLAVEAKTSADGPVSDRDVSFQGLREHREKINASTTILIGPEFHRRIHAEAAADPHLAVLHAQTLADAVLWHARTPFSPHQLQVLFDAEMPAEARGIALQCHHDERTQLLAVLAAVITQLDLERRDENPMYEGAWLGPNELRRDLRKLGAPHDIVVQALQLLSSPFIGVAEERKGRYRLTGPTQLISARLQSVISNIQ